MQIPAPDSRSDTSYGNAGGSSFSAPRKSQGSYPYVEPCDDPQMDDMELVNGIDTKLNTTRYRPSSPADSIADPSSFIDGSSRIHEIGAGSAGGLAGKMFTTGNHHGIGSMKGWSSSPTPLPGDDDPEYTLKDIFDEEGRYLKRVQRDVQVIEALHQRIVSLKQKQRKQHVSK